MLDLVIECFPLDYSHEHISYLLDSFFFVCRTYNRRQPYFRQNLNIVSTNPLSHLYLQKNKYLLLDNFTGNHNSYGLIPVHVIKEPPQKPSNIKTCLEPIKIQFYSEIPDNKNVLWRARWFQIINRANCSILPASDDWFHFPIKRWGRGRANLLASDFYLMFTLLLRSNRLLKVKVSILNLGRGKTQTINFYIFSQIFPPYRRPI